MLSHLGLHKGHRKASGALKVCKSEWDINQFTSEISYLCGYCGKIRPCYKEKKIQLAWDFTLP
jgi:hypothetical protein